MSYFFKIKEFSKKIINFFTQQNSKYWIFIYSLCTLLYIFEKIILNGRYIPLIILNIGIKGLLLLIIYEICNMIKKEKKDIGINTIFFLLLSIPILVVDFSSSFSIFCSIITFVPVLSSFQDKLFPELSKMILRKGTKICIFSIVAYSLIIISCLYIWGYVLNCENIEKKINNLLMFFTYIWSIFSIFLIILKYQTNVQKIVSKKIIYKV